MLKKLMDKLQSLAAPDNPFDPSRFGDPVAMQTGWTPARGGGASFRTHKLIQIDFNRLEFKASAGARLFYLFFILMGAAFSIFFLIEKLSSENFSFDIEIIIPAVIGLVFVAVGSVLYYLGTAPIVFNKYKGSFWKGWKEPNLMSGDAENKKSARLENIHALQIISEYCRSDKSSYVSYELNLVLKNGSRINVIDHGSLSKLREDAQTLSKFLGKPIWDAV